MMAKFNGCDDNCFECPYSDCLKPSYKMNVDKDLQKAMLVRKGESRPHMYTVELGGGHDTPLISKKFYR
jgi:hypothetical protein